MSKLAATTFSELLKITTSCSSFSFLQQVPGEAIKHVKLKSFRNHSLVSEDRVSPRRRYTVVMLQCINVVELSSPRWTGWRDPLCPQTMLQAVLQGDTPFLSSDHVAPKPPESVRGAALPLSTIFVSFLSHVQQSSLPNNQEPAGARSRW